MTEDQSVAVCEDLDTVINKASKLKELVLSGRFTHGMIRRDIDQIAAVVDELSTFAHNNFK